MRTDFTSEQLKDPDIRESESILRKCVHCGFCTATCPTYILTGDELDSPRGRISLIQNMLESDAPPTHETVHHIDRCLSCLACTTTCPSGVNYMHLVDHARKHISSSYGRPMTARFYRGLLSGVMTRPSLFRGALFGAKIGYPFRDLLPDVMKRMLELARSSAKKTKAGLRPGVHRTAEKSVGRVALLQGCVQSSLDPEINESSVRTLNRLGFDVSVVAQASCCGSLPFHLGDEKRASAHAQRTIDAFFDEIENQDADFLVVNTSGCGTMMKDYGFQFRDDPGLSERAALIAQKTVDIAELLFDLKPEPTGQAAGTPIAYHAACSLEHGQKVQSQPRALLTHLGFDVREVDEGHLCCGSAGTYNILQGDLSDQLRARKVERINKTRAEIACAGNIGCLTQLAGVLDMPIVHTVQMVDWATGGPSPLS